MVDGTLNQQVNGVSQAYGTTSANLTWLGTARGTIGFAGDRMMVYGTGGFAFGRINMSSSANWSDSNLYTCAETGTFAGTCAGFPQGNTTTVASWAGSQTGMKYGYAAGGGFGYAVTDHLIAKTEVLYYDLGSSTLTVNGTGTRTVGGGSINIPPPNTSEAGCGLQLYGDKAIQRRGCQAWLWPIRSQPIASHELREAACVGGLFHFRTASLVRPNRLMPIQ